VLQATSRQASAPRPEPVTTRRRWLLGLGEALLEVSALLRQLRELLLLPLVLFLRQGIDAAERLAPALEPLELRRELVAILALGGLRTRRLDPPLELFALCPAKSIVRVDTSFSV